MNVNDQESTTEGLISVAETSSSGPINQSVTVTDNDNDKIKNSAVVEILENPAVDVFLERPEAPTLEIFLQHPTIYRPKEEFLIGPQIDVSRLAIIYVALKYF